MVDRDTVRALASLVFTILSLFGLPFFMAYFVLDALGIPMDFLPAAWGAAQVLWLFAWLEHEELWSEFNRLACEWVCERSIHPAL